MITSDTSIETALQPVKLLERICKGSRDIGSRFAVQPIHLDEPGTSSRISDGAYKVPCGLGVVVGALATSGVTSCNPQPSEPGVVHDHIRLRQHQVAVIACIVAAISARHMEHAGTTEGGETVGSSACGSQLSPGGHSAEMISDSRSKSDSRLGDRRTCAYAVDEMTDGFQALLTISSSRPITVSSKAKILYSLPGITTLLSSEDMDGSTVRPLHSDSTVDVALGEVPADLTVVASSPQIPTSGHLAWSYSIADPDLPDSYRVSRLSRERRENCSDFDLPCRRPAGRVWCSSAVATRVVGSAAVSRSTLSPHTGNVRAVRRLSELAFGRTNIIALTRR